MFKVEALIQPYKLDEIQTALQEFKTAGIIVTEASDYAPSATIKSTYRGSEYRVAVPRTKVEVLVSSLQVDEVVETILRVARTPSPLHDGIVVAYEVADAIRIHDGERVNFALL